MFRFEFLKIFDFFGYVPQFRIKGEERFTSKFGGFLFLIFIVLIVGFIIFETYSFILTLNDLKLSVLIYTKEESIYHLTNEDIYFGIAIKDLKGNIKKNSEIPYLDFTFSFVHNSGNEFQAKESPLGKCNISKFYYPDDLKLIDKQKLENAVENYLCPVDFNETISSSIFLNTKYLSIKIKLKDSFVNSTKFDQNLVNFDLLSSFIYSNSAFNSKNKFDPYFSQINHNFIRIDSSLSKITVFNINSFETMDSDSLFYSNNFYNYQNKSYSRQPNGTVFQITKGGDSTSFIKSFQDPTPVFQEIRLALKNTKTQNFRSYKNFMDLFNTIGSLLPNIYLSFLIFAKTVNQVKGKNTLMSSLYSHEILRKLKEFHADQNIRRTITKKASNPYLTSLNLYNELESKGSYEDKIRNETVNNDNIKNTKLVEKHKVRWNIDNLFEKGKLFKLSFQGYVKSLICDDPKSRFMRTAYDNFHDSIEIDSFLFFKQEFDLFKELLLDKTQRTVFEMLSKYRSFRKLFEKLRNEQTMSITECISKIYERGNKKDLKLIQYLENNLEIRDGN